jgi:hypothetical protein
VLSYGVRVDAVYVAVGSDPLRRRRPELFFHYLKNGTKEHQRSRKGLGAVACSLLTAKQSSPSDRQTQSF